MRIGKIANSAEHRTDEQFQKIPNFWNFDSFPSFKIPEIR